MKYILILISLAISISSVAMSHYDRRLTFPAHITEQYDDTCRLVSIESELFNALLETAEQDATPDKTELINLKRRIVSGIVNLRSSQERCAVLLTQKEFYMSLLQYLPWDGDMVFGSVRVLIQNNPKTLQIGTSDFWHSNKVKLLE